MMGTREKTKPESLSIHVSFRRGMYKRVTNTVCSNHDYLDLPRATSFQKVISSPSPVPTRISAGCCEGHVTTPGPSQHLTLL